MFRINEWQMRREQKLSCGHTAEQGSTAFAITLVVCEHDVARTTETCVRTLESMRAEPWKPSFLYQLWHFLWGKKRQKKLASTNLSHALDTKRGTPLGKTTCFIARQKLTLDCGHTVKAGELYRFTSVYTCGQEGVWPLTVLLSCFRFRHEQTRRR